MSNPQIMICTDNIRADKVPRINGQPRIDPRRALDLRPSVSRSQCNVAYPIKLSLALDTKAMNLRVFKVVNVQRVKLQGNASVDQIGMVGVM